MGLVNWLEGRISGNRAEINTDGEVLVAPTRDPEKMGLVAIGCINDDGSVTGIVESRGMRVSELNRLSVGLDSLIMSDTFNYIAQNTGNYGVYATTQTVTLTGGYKVVNGSNVTSINTSSAWQTRRNFALYNGFALHLDFNGLHTAAPQINAVTEWGLLTATMPGVAVPTDGVFFRFTSAGTFKAVISYAGAETVSVDLPVPTANENHKYRIIADAIHAEFWVDGKMVADFDTPAGQGQPFASPTLPLTVRHYIGASAPGAAMQFKTSGYDVSLSDANTTRPWSQLLAGMGMGGYQGQNGGTLGSTANYANSANPTAAVPTNTTAALGTGLGGQFWETATLAIGTDGIISSYQNPVGTTTAPGRTLYIAGVHIASYIEAAVTGGPYVNQWSLATGHTALSLATAEAATTKAPRRDFLGMQLVPVTAAVSTLVANNIDITFDTPRVVLPGEFVATVVKHRGTVATAGTVAHGILFDTYWE